MLPSPKGQPELAYPAYPRQSRQAARQVICGSAKRAEDGLQAA
jgi:hypothetical protein